MFVTSQVSQSVTFVVNSTRTQYIGLWLARRYPWRISSHPAPRPSGVPYPGVPHIPVFSILKPWIFASLPVTPCSVCHQHLCSFCDQAKCECGQLVCLACTVIVPDGTPSGLRLCKPCAHAADPLCPFCGEFARMMPRQNSEPQWFECTAYGAAMDADEIAAAQQVPAPRRQPGIAQAFCTGPLAAGCRLWAECQAPSVGDGDMQQFGISRLTVCEDAVCLRVAWVF